MDSIFIDPGELPDGFGGTVQVLTLGAAYGYVLFHASNMLSDGSELLLLVPSIAGIVGSIVLPILGAVPDGAIMLFSGLGPDAQEQLSVGVGALAGSTVMLLTLPWGLAILSGRVRIDARGHPHYSIKRSRARAASSEVINSKLGERPTLFNTGVAPLPAIADNAKLMILTAVGYLLIQGPALQFARGPGSGPKFDRHVSQTEHWFALAGFVLMSAMFVGYLGLMLKQSRDTERTASLVDLQIVKQLHEHGSLTLSGLVAPMLESVSKRVSEKRFTGTAAELHQEVSSSILGDDRRRLNELLSPFFRKYDTDGNGTLGVEELRALLFDLNETVTPEQARTWMARFDSDGSGCIDRSEFLDAMLMYVADLSHASVIRTHSASEMVSPEDGGGGNDEDDEVENIEVPDDIEHLDPQQQQRLIKWRAAKKMLIGTVLILIISDPMVDVLDNMGTRLGIPSFYISFVLAPLASNASELIAAISYAKKKTRSSITVALSTLEGAACMNNTFCLAIFMGLIYARGLAWHFTAETVAILVVEVAIGCVAMLKVQRAYVGVGVLSLFPLSLLFVMLMEKAGYD